MAERSGRRHPALIRAAAFAFLAWAGAVMVQAHPAVDARDDLAEPWRWVTFGAESGLPSDVVLDVLESSSGIPWVATTAGIAWFDGHAWIPVLDGEVARDGRAEKLARWGSDGIVAVIGGEVVLATPHRHERVPLSWEGERQGAWAAAEGRPGELIVLAGAHRLRPDKILRMRPHEATPARLDGSAPRSPTQMLATYDGSILISSMDGLFKMTADGWSLLLPPGAERHVIATGIGAGEESLVSITSPVLQRGLWSVRSGEAPSRISEPALALCRTTGEEVLGVFESGAVRLRRDGAWSDVKGRGDLMRGISSVCRRDNGDLWFGTDRGVHLNRRSSQLWESWRMPGPDARNQITGILPRADGSTWLATAGGIVIRHPDGTMEAIDELGGKPLLQVTALGEDARGRVYAGSGAAWSGTWRWDGSWKHLGAAEGFPAERVHAVRTLADGRTFFLCLPSGPWSSAPKHPAVYLLRDDDTFEPWGAERGLGTARAYDVALGPEGTLWFGTAQGLVRLRDGESRVFAREDGVPFSRAFCVAVGPDGRAWSGSQEKGLAIVGPDDRVERLSSADGLVDDDVWDLAFDDRGRLWVTTRRGVAMIAEDDIVAFRGDSGLGVTRTWPVVVQGNRVFIGTLGAGVSVLNLDALDATAPRVRLQPPVIESNAALVRWSALSSWGDPQPRDVETRTRFDDHEWSPWSGKRELMLHRLAPGEHAVDVEARGMLGAGERASARTRFEIPQPAWRQAAFLSLATAILVAAASALVYLWARSRRERRALEASERRYRQLVENATEIVFALDASGRIAWANPAAADALDRLSGELTGHDVLDAVAPESHATARDAMLRVRSSGEVVMFEVLGLVKDGSRRLVEIALGPGPAGGWQGIGRDITDRRRRDDEKQRAHRLESMGLLAGGVAHDFNNVLAGVVGHVGLAMLEVPADSPAKARLEQIERAAMRCADLARQMLDYAGRGRFVVGPVDVGNMVREAVALTETSLPRRATVVVEVAEGLPAVEGDASQLQRVVDNLVRNAAEAGGDESIRVSVRPAAAGAGSVRGTWACPPPAGPVLLVSVHDGGEGMDEATIARAFDPFFSTRKEGRGLGLAATLGIVRAHGGGIAVESGPDQGATFTVVLPVVLPVAQAGRPGRG